MLVIRDAQMGAFQRHLEENFQRRLRHRLQRVLPGGPRLAMRELDEQIRVAIDQAMDCGLSKEADVALFVETVFTHLEDFPERGLPKEIRPALYAYGVDPSLKVDRFIHWCKSQATGARP